MATEGIEIPCVIKTDKFDRQIDRLNKQIDLQEKKKVNIEVELDVKKAERQNLQKIGKPIKEERDNLVRQLKAIEAKPSVSVEEKTAYDMMYDRYVEVNHQFNELIRKNNSLQKATNNLQLQHDKITSSVNEYKSKINSINLQKHQADIEKVKNSFNDVGSNIQRTITKVGRLAIGIIGIRTAMSGLRRASSDLASYDKQYSANLEYIRFALTQAIAPVLRYIVSLAATVLSYINAILHALFGINIFSNASGEAFKRMKKNAGGVDRAVGGAAKSAKELKKQLAGFDEVNMLQDENENTGGGGRRWCRRS